MFVQQNASVGRLSRATGLAPIAALVGGALLAGAFIGATLTWQLNRSITSESANATPQATFDAVQFRAEERARVATPQATFDAVQFRAEERAPLAP
jgi:phosphoglycerol transferase MdoB-like AlkP superfamily enzyme